LFIYFLFIASVLVHYPVLLNEIINWKDDELFFHLSSNAAGAGRAAGQADLSSAVDAWYSLQYGIAGNGYFLYHAVSVLLHTVNALLLFALLLRFGASAFLSMGTALFFAVHPVHVESLTIVSNQTTLLSFLFIQCGVLFTARALERGGWIDHTMSVVAALGFYVLGFPALTFLFASVLVHQSFRREWRFIEQWPVMVLWSAALVVAVWDQQVFNYGWKLFSESVAMIRYGVVEQFLRIADPWSAPLRTGSVSDVARAQVFLGMVFPFFVISVVTAAVLFRKKNPVLFIGAMLIIAGSLPLMTAVSRGAWTFADDGMYSASAGWGLVILWLIERLYRRIQDSTILRRMVLGAVVVLGLFLSFITVARAPFFMNGDVYWSRVLEENPNDHTAMIKKGMYHFFRFEYEPALRSLDAAVAAAPNEYESHYTRGLINLNAMFLPEARKDYTLALQLNPSSADAYFGIGSIHSLYDRHDSAAMAFSEAIRISPNFLEAYASRATMYGNLGRFVESYADFQRALTINPRFGVVYGNRALVSLQAGNAQAAQRDFTMQIGLEPKNVTARIHSALTAVLLADTLTAVLQLSKSHNIDSLRTKLYLSTALQTFLKTKSEVELGSYIQKKAIGNN
jgi:tetratricopeptide (TPR) repeat protein